MSVIVPVYNVEKFVCRCLDSIINQTYQNLEIIIVDDGSTDNGGAICDQYAAYDNRIIVLHTENQGLSAARNEGMKYATGQYVGFVDSDDYLHTSMYETLVLLAMQYNADIVAGEFKKVYEDDKVKDKPIDIEKSKVIACSGIDMYDKRYNDTDNYFLTVVWNKIYRRDIVKNHPFPNGKINEDEFVIHHYCYDADSVVFIKKPLYYYLQRKNSIMGIIKNSYTVKRQHILLAEEDRIFFLEDKVSLKVMKMIINRYVCNVFENYYGVRKWTKDKANMKELYSKIEYIHMYVKARNIKIKYHTGIFLIMPNIYYFMFKFKRKMIYMFGGF